MMKKNEGAAVQWAASDDKLFEMLKELRHREAKKKHWPPFVIFPESSLQDMATMYPTTMLELEKCQGVSGAKHCAMESLYRDDREICRGK